MARIAGAAQSLTGGTLGGPATGRGRALAIGGLVLANLMPVVGVVWLGWDPGNLLIAYWLENIAVGAWTIPRICTARGSDEGRKFRLEINGTNVGNIPRPLVLPVFILNYGLFTLVHGGFVLVFAGGVLGGFFSPEPSGSFWGESLGYIAMLVALLLAHGIAYVQHWIGDEERDRTGPRGAMVAPYGRLFVMHIAVLGVGAALILTGATGVGQALVLVAVKTAFDVGSYVLAQHRQRARRAPASPA